MIPIPLAGVAAISHAGSTPPVGGLGAVHFLADTAVKNEVLDMVNNSGKVSFFFWFKQATPQVDNNTIWVVDPQGVYGSVLQMGSPNGLNCTVSVGDVGFDAYVSVASIENLTAGVWHSILYSVDMSFDTQIITANAVGTEGETTMTLSGFDEGTNPGFAVGQRIDVGIALPDPATITDITDFPIITVSTPLLSNLAAPIVAVANPKQVKVYIDDVDCTAFRLFSAISFGTGPTIFNNDGLPFWVGDDSYGDGAVMDMADFWFTVGNSLLNGAGIIPEVTRRKFVTVDNTPVDLGADGSIPTGTAPTIFLHRDSAAAAATFANNLGTGGNFEIVGALTNATTNP